MKRGGAPRVVAVLAGLLERAAERGDAEGAQTAQPAPGIPVRRYAERIYRYAGCSPACFVAAYVYLDRLVLDQQIQDGDAGEAAAGVVVDSHTVHRLLITAVMVAAKFMDDRHHNNAYFARVGGVEVAEMNALELRLLFALRFRLNVAPDAFARYCAALEAEMLLLDDGCSSAPPLPPPPQEEEEDDEERRRGRGRQARLQDAAAGTGSRAALVVADTRRLAAALVEIAQ